MQFRGMRSFLLGPVLLACMAGMGQTWEVFDMNTAGLPNNTVKALAVAPNDEVWVGTEFGLCRFDGSNWQTFQTGSSGLPDNDIRALAVDDTGTVWVGTLNGLARYTNGTWTVFDMGNSNIPENYVRSLCTSPLGGIWVGTVGGLAWFDGGSTWHVYNDGPSSHDGLVLPGSNIAAVKVREDGLVCIGTVNAGFTYLTDTSVTVYNTFSNGLPDNTALGVALDSQGWRWLACPAGALLNHAGDFVGGAWVQYSTVNSMLPSNSLTSIVVDGHDRRIIGNQISGLTIFQGFSSFSTYNTQNSDIPSNEVLSLALDHDGRVWVGTSNGGAARFGYAVGIDDGQRGDGIATYPNPASDVLHIEAGAAYLGGAMRLLDLSGRQVRTGRLGRSLSILNVDALPAGVYLLELADAQGGSKAVRRVVLD